MISRPGARIKLRNAPFWAVFALEVTALAYAGASPQHWLRAVGFMALGLVLAGVARLVLTDDQAGFLRVRGRLVDVFCYLAFGVLAITFGLGLPQR